MAYPQNRQACCGAGWTGGADYVRPAATASRGTAGSITIPLSDKPSASVMIGQATGLRYRDPDALALRVGTAVLGRGFTHLGLLMRQRQQVPD